MSQVLFMRIVTLIISCSFLAISIFTVWHYQQTTYVKQLSQFNYYLLIFGISFVGFAVSTRVLFLSKKHQVNLLLVCLSTGIGVYTCELVLAHLNDDDYGKVKQGQLVQVLKQENLAGNATYPLLMIPNLLNNDLHFDDPDFLFPLSGIPKVRTVLCNEQGPWVFYEADRFGFRNDDAVYELPADLVMIGDSFGHGYCVDNENSTQAYLIREYGNVINLSMSGLGPILELAILKEYASHIKPPIVLWFYFEGNDLFNLKAFSHHAIFRYVNQPEWNQSLWNKSDQVEISMKQKVANMFFIYEHTSSQFVRFISLAEVTKLIKKWVLENIKVHDESVDIFKTIMHQAKQLVSSWGGELYMVYLPSSHTYLSQFDFKKERVIQAMRETEIPVIDFQPALERQGDPMNLFTAIKVGHYNEVGYRLLAETIIEYFNHHSTDKLNSTPHK